MVLIALAIMLVSATSIFVRYNRLLFVATNNYLFSQSKWYVDGIEGIVMKYMRDDFKKNPSKVFMDMNWAQPNQVIPLDEAIISGSVKDEMACFNINSLAASITYSTDSNKNAIVDSTLKETPYQILVFREILKYMGADDVLAQTISDSAADWIDTDTATRSSYSAEDQFYIAQKNPRVTNKNIFYDKSELRAINGMTAELYRRIEPLICALPTTDFKISINMLEEKQAPVLAALFLGSLSLEEAVALIKNRPSYGWDSSAGFFREDNVESRSNSRGGLKTRIINSIVVNSNYFVANVLVQFDDRKYAFTSRIFRDSESKLKVYQRLIGELYE